MAPTYPPAHPWVVFWCLVSTQLVSDHQMIQTFEGGLSNLTWLLLFRSLSKYFTLKTFFVLLRMTEKCRVSLFWIYHINASVCLSVCLSVRLYVCLSVCLFACLQDRLSACLSVCLSVCLSLCLSVCLSTYLPVCLFAGPPVCLSACLPVCLSAYLSIKFYLGSVSLSVCTSVLHVSLSAFDRKREREKERKREREKERKREREKERVYKSLHWSTERGTMAKSTLAISNVLDS